MGSVFSSGAADKAGDAAKISSNLSPAIGTSTLGQTVLPAISGVGTVLGGISGLMGKEPERAPNLSGLGGQGGLGYQAPPAQMLSVSQNPISAPPSLGGSFGGGSQSDLLALLSQMSNRQS